MSTTLVARSEQSSIDLLGANVTATNPQSRAMLEATRQTLMAHGVNAAVATRRAYALLFASIERQAAIPSFLKIFRVLAFIFVAVIPLLLLMHRATRPDIAGH